MSLQRALRAFGQTVNHNPELRDMSIAKFDKGTFTCSMMHQLGIANISRWMRATVCTASEERAALSRRIRM
jgi:hypothetical protein